MSKYIALCDGHGMETSGKRTPTGGVTSPETGKNFMHENEFNRAVVKYLDVELRRCGFRTLLVAPTDTDTSLQERVAKANSAGVDFYLSIHANANTGTWGTWGGTETLTYPSGTSLTIGRIIHKHIMKGTPLRDRGVKDGSGLYVIKNTKMPAVLVECAFMDNLDEAKLLISDTFRKECARELAMALCESYGVAYVTEQAPVAQTAPATTASTTGEIYRVRLNWSDAKTQKGAYTNLDSAKKLADDLMNEGDYKVFNNVGTVVYDPQPVKDDGAWYRVRKDWNDASSQIGAFHDVEGAKQLVDSKPNQGYEVYDDSGNLVYPVVVATPQPVSQPVEQMYRVRLTWEDAKSQIGAYQSLSSAKALADSRVAEGYKVFGDSGELIYEPLKKVETVAESVSNEPVVVVQQPVNETISETPAPAEDVHKGHNDIIGESIVNIDKIISFVKSKNPNAQDIDEIVKQFIEVGKVYGVRGDMALCQSIIETGWFTFSGGTAVTPDQHNYCGLGVTSKGMKGNSFTTVKDGVTAQIQHLFAYACKNELPSGEVLLDPRYKYVTRGIAPHWEDLSNRWAMNANYGTHIVSMFEQLNAFVYTPPVVIEETKQPEKPIVTEVEEQKEPELTDEEKAISIGRKIIDYLIEQLKKLFKL